MAIPKTVRVIRLALCITAEIMITNAHAIELRNVVVCRNSKTKMHRIAVKISGIAWSKNHGMEVRKHADSHIDKKIHLCFNDIGYSCFSGFACGSAGNNLFTSWKMPTKSKINGGRTTISPRMGWVKSDIKSFNPRKYKL